MSGVGGSWRAALLALLVCASSHLVAVPAHALACGSSCEPDPSPPSRPPSSCGSYCPPGVHAPVTISGRVENRRHQSLIGAAVYWQYGMVTTDPSGRYSISVWADEPVTLVADAHLYAWKSLYIDNPILAAALSQDFTLAFLLQASVDPKAFNNSPPKTLTFTIYSTVPQSDTRMIVQLPSGAPLDLSFDVTYSDPEAWKRWSGSWTVPFGSVDGRYRFKSCALDAAAPGSCDAPGGILLSQVKSGTFVVDSVGPVLSGAAPSPNHNTLLRRPTIALVIRDALSGADATSLTLLIDGLVMSPAFDSVSGRLSFVPSSDLALGVHTVRVEASDLAGNRSSLDWQFDVVSISASVTSATVTRTTILVNPAHSLPPPSSVTFSATPTQLQPYDVSLTQSALWSGRGTLSRSVVFDGLRVTFENELGQSVTVPAATVSTNFSHDIGVLEPQGVPLGVRLPSATATLPNVSVAVPTGFVVTDGSTATLWAEPQSASGIVVAGESGDPLPTGIDCSSAANCRVSGVVRCRVNEASGGPDYSCDGTYPRAALLAGPLSWPVNIFSIIDYANTVQQDPNRGTYRKDPEPNPQENCGRVYGYSCANLLRLEDPVFRLTTYWATGPLLRAYGHHYFFSMTGNGINYVTAWQASDVNPGSTGCRNVKPILFGHAIESTSASWGTTGPSYFRPTIGALDQLFTSVPPEEDVGFFGPQARIDASGHLVYSLGGVGTSHNVDLSDVVDSGGRLRGQYVPLFGGSVSDDGELIDVPGKAARNFWQPSDAYRSAYAEVMTATEFSSSAPGAYDFQASLYFQFRVSDAC